MLHDFYQHLPLRINPIVFSIGFFSVRWYALSYVAGFLTVYLLLLWRIRHGEVSHFLLSNSSGLKKSKTQETVLDYLLVVFFSALVGGRLGFVLFYDAVYFLSHPLSIISPYDQGGNFIGIFGMSYHGALLGIIVGSYFFLKKRQINFFAWADFIVPAVSLGYFFGRIGNFLNGELFGRITQSSWGMYFTADPTHLRHPSQLYEAFLEGILLFVILWKMRNMKLRKGTLLAVYLVGYGMLRIIGEQFREPDPQVGILFGFFTMGQLLSVAMVLTGGFFLISKREK